MNIRNCTSEDVGQVGALVNRCKPLLILHTAYTYWVLFKYMSSTCFVLEENGKIIGYTTALRSTDNPDILFWWQMGIEEEYRGRKYSFLLTEAIVKKARALGCKHIQFTIDSSNRASYGSVSSYANKNKISMKKIGESRYHHVLDDKDQKVTIYQYDL